MQARGDSHFDGASVLCGNLTSSLQPRDMRHGLRLWYPPCPHLACRLASQAAIDPVGIREPRSPTPPPRLSPRTMKRYGHEKSVSFHGPQPRIPTPPPRLSPPSSRDHTRPSRPALPGLRPGPSAAAAAAKLRDRLRRPWRRYRAGSVAGDRRGEPRGTLSGGTARGHRAVPLQRAEFKLHLLNASRGRRYGQTNCNSGTATAVLQQRHYSRSDATAALQQPHYKSDKAPGHGVNGAVQMQPGPQRAGDSVPHLRHGH